MKLNRLVLDNFRSHQHLEIDFEPDVTVLVGDNGEGKTSVLDAISQVFGRLATKLPGVSGISLSESDLRIISNVKPRGVRLAPGFRIWLEIDIKTELQFLGGIDEKIESTLYVSRAKTRDKSRTTLLNCLKQMPSPKAGRGSLKEIDRFANALVEADVEDRAYQMPLTVYYGTSRAVFQTPLRRRNFRTKFARFDSLNGALNATSNFKRVFEWFGAKEAEEALTQREKKSFKYRDPELEAVRRAIEGFFPNFFNPRTALRPLRFIVDKIESSEKTVTFDLNQLSDGYRTTLAMVADLACRMVEANPPNSIDDPLNTEAIVLIDEVDLHLHPRWQQRIILDLLRVFPKTQFIVTTHSAQVLSTVEARCIRKLVPAGDVTNVEIPDFSLGAQSMQLMEDIQDVNARPQLPIIGALNRYRALVENDQWDSTEALKLRTQLDKWAANKEPELKRIDVDIKMRAFRRGKK
jgi:predicted ATP-binding protein involved in virulence